MVANKFLEEVDMAHEVRKECVFMCKYFHESVRELSDRSVSYHLISLFQPERQSVFFDCHTAILMLVVRIWCVSIQPVVSSIRNSCLERQIKLSIFVSRVIMHWLLHHLLMAFVD